MVTVGLVVRDEAVLLEACLASIAGAFAEVIVVDHASRDDTTDVARRHGARVLRSTAASHELARNDYVEAATQPWILVLDADERLASTARVHAAVRAAPSEVHGLALERFDYLGHGRWASTRLVRLFRRDPRVRYFDSHAHASVAPSILAYGGLIATADAPLHHLDALLPRDHAAKRRYMRERLERDAASGSAPAVLRCFLALERFAEGDEAGGEHELATALAADARCEPIVTLFRAQRHRAHGRWREAATLAAQVLSVSQAHHRFRGRTSAHAVLADALDRLGEHDAAVAAARAAIAEEPSVASHHVNLAALLASSDADASSAARVRAAELNPWLDDPRIAAPGTRPSIFEQQDALIARVASHPTTVDVADGALRGAVGAR